MLCAEVGQAWDKMRQRVIAEAVRELLMPLMEREARSRLGSAARAAALDAAADRLWAHASQAPLQVCLRGVIGAGVGWAGMPVHLLSPACQPGIAREAAPTRSALNHSPSPVPSPAPSPPPHSCFLQVRLVDEDEAEPERRVMAVCYGPGSPPTTFVMLDPAGNMVDYLHCSQFRCPPSCYRHCCAWVGGVLWVDDRRREGKPVLLPGRVYNVPGLAPPTPAPLCSGLIPKRKALPGLVYNMYEDPKKGQDAARVRSFIEVRGCVWVVVVWSVVCALLHKVSQSNRCWLVSRMVGCSVGRGSMLAAGLASSPACLLTTHAPVPHPPPSAAGPPAPPRYDCHLHP